jgi:hypothetical protein
MTPEITLRHCWDVNKPHFYEEAETFQFVFISLEVKPFLAGIWRNVKYNNIPDNNIDPQVPEQISKL